MRFLLTTVWLTGFFQDQQRGLCSIQYTRETMPGAQFYDGKKLNIPISAKAGFELYERWAHQGISGIMSAVAKKRAENLNEYHRNKLFKCSQNAENIIEQARCIVQAIDAKPRHADYSTASRFEDLKKRKTVVRRPISVTITTDVTHRFVFRTKRTVVNRYNYKLLSEYETKTPFGILGKYLSRTVKMIKQKDEKQSWTTMISKIETMQTTIKNRQQIANALENRLKFGALRRKGLNMKELKDSLIQPKDLRKQEHVEPEVGKAIDVTKMLRSVVKLAMMLNDDGNTTATDNDNRAVKIGSPRLLSLKPEEAKDEISILSPKLFSLHDQGDGIEKLTSIPHLLKAAVGSEYEEWLNFIAEASGAMDTVDTMEKQFSESAIPEPWSSMPRGIDGQPMYFTKQNLSDIDPAQAENVKLFEKITKSLTLKQLTDFNTTGYSMLTREQLIQLYGPSSPYNDSTVLNRFLAINPESIHNHVIQAIRYLAKSEPASMRRRSKRQLKNAALSPILLGAFIFNPEGTSIPVILSPVVLTPLVFSPAIFGAVILSPWVFVPIIISPRLMCPAIVSPSILSAFVLSPLLLDPFILSPGALIPYILSPKLLSPNVLSPSVMTPLVLNPFCLSPNILSPTALNAIVLSPFVLSPFVYSPNYIAALVFSPSALSPLINSTGKGIIMLFSPTVLS